MAPSPWSSTKYQGFLLLPSQPQLEYTLTLKSY